MMPIMKMCFATFTIAYFISNPKNPDTAPVWSLRTPAYPIMVRKGKG
jgi:hypothetical protein